MKTHELKDDKQGRQILGERLAEVDRHKIRRMHDMLRRQKLPVQESSRKISRPHHHRQQRQVHGDGGEDV